MVYNGTAWESVGSVDSLAGTAPIQVSLSGGVATISIDAADGDSAGSMSSTHYNLVNGATDANTASTLVKRDSSGNFTAGTISATSVSISGTVTNATDAATKAYVDGVASGLDVKASVRVATTANLDLSDALENGDTVDGVTLATGDRVLVKNQSTGSQNGIYVVQASGAAVRAADADSSAEVTPGLFTFVEEGTANGNTGWVLTTDAPITLGTTALVFSQFSGAATVTGGNGLTLTGTDLSVNVDDSTIEISADSLRVKDNGITSAKMATGSVELNTDTVTGTLGVSNGGIGVTTAADNTVFAGPATGGPSAPSFRALVAGDIPNHSTDKLTSGTLGVARGGTGVATFTAGIVKSTGGTDALTTGSTISLTTEVSGTLPVANGGTGASTLTSGGVLLGNGTSTIGATAAGTADQVLRVPGAGGSPSFGSIDLAQSAAVGSSILPIANGGTGASTASAALTALGGTSKYTAQLGDGSATTYTISHGLGNIWVTAEVFQTSDGEKVYPDISVGLTTGTPNGTVVLSFASAPTSNQYRVVIIG
jgi:phage-related tail fiber protein